MKMKNKLTTLLLFKTNLLILSLYTIAFYLIDKPIYLTIPLGISLILLFGINSAYIFQKILKRFFTKWEFLSISLFFIFTLLPFLLLIENFILGEIYTWLPFLNIFLSFIPICFFAYKNKTEVFLSLNISKDIFKSPFLWVFLFSSAIVSIVIFAYPHLPDKDPYTWIFRLEKIFENKNIIGESSRSLFPLFTFNFINILGINIFIFFKYILPFLFLSALFPAWLIAKNFKSKLKQTAFLLTIFAAPNTILYSLTAMPQIIFIYLLFFFIFFLAYSFIKKDNLFYYLAGVMATCSVLYHEAAIIVFAIWFFATIYKERKFLFKNKTQTFLIILILISNFHFIQKYTSFAFKWIRRIFIYIFEKPTLNYLFPAKYTNIDGSLMGWETFGGTIKYYGFYIGPLILGFIILLFVINKKGVFRDTFSLIRKNISLIILFLSFLVFFLISEILPRFPGISMLPDRSWVFGGILFILFIFSIFHLDEKNKFIKKYHYYILILFIFIGIIGALYINNSKKYLATKAELESANWIKNNLPKNRTFFSTGKTNILRYHADSNTIGVPSNFYFDENQGIETILDPPENRDLNKFEEYVSNIEKEVENTRERIPKLKSENSQKKFLDNFSKKIIEHSNNFSNSLKEISLVKEKEKDKNLYIYYSEINPKNPYAQRSYSVESWGVNPQDTEIIFDQYPDKFQKIYEDKENKIMIWKIL
jgi:hypothetical protein